MKKVAFIAVLTGLATPAGAASDGSVDEGRKISQANCTRCHVVGTFNPNGGISSTPSFQLLVNALKDWQERFDTFYARPPHPAVIIIKGIKKSNDLPYNAAPLELTQQNVKDITAFAKTLKKK